MNKVYYANELYHHGVEGMKWGIRRYQNEDGTLTPEGRKHYGYDDNPKTMLGTMKKNIIDSHLIGTKYKGIKKLGTSRSIENTAKTYENWSKYYANKAKNSKNKVWKAINERSSFNNAQFAKYYKQAMKYSDTDKMLIAGTMFDEKYRNMKVKTLFSDSTMTMGEQYLMESLVGGVGSHKLYN